ncbi:MAG TPA: excinuclease ABC subunit C [Prevotellaceae bacterium]|jgi:excinuclease ABC subunit C|nr:excinuclease ABC subunit C [Prevotellaceae bacterium]
MTKEEQEKLDAYLKGIIRNLPEKPGSYQYLDETGTIIYIGKAKNLKRRVSSYFNKEQNKKTAMLVSKIRDIKYIVVETETDALLLENNLIKKYKPKYNILLKDDKTYPSICISKEEFPRIFKTRRIDLKGGQYFGPYSHEGTMYALLELINKLYQPRPCRLPLKEEDIKKGKFKVCLNYHMHKCKGPCIGEQSKEEYTKHINDSREILKGNISQILKEMRSEMEQLGKDLNFEEAQQIKNKYEMLVSFQAKSEIVNASNTNIDVFNIETDDKHAYINYLHVVQGSIIQAFTFEYTKKMEESQEELLVMGIVEMRNRFKSTSKEIVIPFEIEYPDPDVTLTIPQKGDKKKLLDLSHLNVKQYKFDRLKQVESSHPEQKTLRLMTEIKDALHLPTLPVQIELFDNSNISGTDAVAGCVVFRKLKPSKSEYRKYNIKTVVGPDDYASMQEVVRRRYSRNIEENLPMPDLIITDGGIGQMNCVREVIEDELHLSIPIAGLAKNDKHRTNELLYGFPAQTIGMKTTSELFRLLTRMQDEVHRYAITFHRQKRSKHQTASELDSIKGVGESTKHLLLKEFKSVKRIKNADLTQLQNLLGKKKGENLYHAFHQDKQ